MKDDIVFVHGRSEDGTKLSVVRKRGDTLSAGVLSTLREGAPIEGEVLQLKPREGMPLLCDVEVVHEGRASALPTDDIARSSGPVKVTSPAYRSGWDAIWGSSRTNSLPN